MGRIVLQQLSVELLSLLKLAGPVVLQCQGKRFGTRGHESAPDGAADDGPGFILPIFRFSRSLFLELRFF